MNETETRADLIDPKLKKYGQGLEWGLINFCWFTEKTSIRGSFLS